MKIVKRTFMACVLLCSALSCTEVATIELGPTDALSPHSPQIVGLRYMGQSPKSAEVLIFEVDFKDADADLEQGILSAAINGVAMSSATLQLKKVFRENELDPKSTVGVLRFPVAIVVDSEAPTPQIGAFSVGIQLIDAAGHHSNWGTAKLTISP